MEFADGYEGVTVAGIAVVRFDGDPMVFLAQRSFDETDDNDVRETWEFPGGHLNPDEDPFTAAAREFEEEIGFPLPPGEVINGWRSEDGHYQGFVYEAHEFPTLTEWQSTSEVQKVGWFTEADTQKHYDVIRPEVRKTDWGMIFTPVSGNDLTGVTAMVDKEPALSMEDLIATPIPIHGVLAPEATMSGDSRGFNAGSMTKRPGRIPFRWQESDIGGHDGAVVTGSVDRMMRKDGLIHYEGSLMPTKAAGDLVEMIAFFGNRFGVSVDGDRGSLDMSKTEEHGVLWYDAIRAAGLTAVAIPAFAEAYVSLGPHPDMPSDEALVASMHDSGDLITFDRGPGWVTDPKETKRIHDYWTKKGEPGYAKIAWGTNGDFTRCVKLVGEKIATNSPEKARFIKQTCAQWHHDALGYWPGDLGKPGNAPDTPENRRRAATHASLETLNPRMGLDHIEVEGIEVLEASDEHELETSQWEAVLVSSVSGNARPPLAYFHRQENTEALVVEEPDANGFRHTYGYAAEWGVCHIGLDNRCVEPPFTGSDDYPEFHLGRTRTEEGVVYTGVLTYGVGHRDAQTILSESPDQAYFDNINNAWAAVRVGEDERGIWFSGVVLPGVPEEHLTKIEASGQVSGEWKRGAMRACLTVNVPGYPVERPSAEYDENGNVMALAASAFTSMQRANGVEESECSQIETPAKIMAALAAAHVEAEMEDLAAEFEEMI